MEEFTMADKSVRYTPEFKRQMVELVRSGRTPASLAKEFGPTPWTISLWVRQDARDAGKSDGGLTSAEREELAQLRRENRKLREEREILSNVWSAPVMQALFNPMAAIRLRKCIRPICRAIGSGP